MNDMSQSRMPAENNDTTIGLFHPEEPKRNSTGPIVAGVVVVLAVVAIGAYIYETAPPSVTPIVAANNLPSPTPPVVNPPG